MGFLKSIKQVLGGPKAASNQAIKTNNLPAASPPSTHNSTDFLSKFHREREVKHERFLQQANEFISINVPEKFQVIFNQLVPLASTLNGRINKEAKSILRSVPKAERGEIFDILLEASIKQKWFIEPSNEHHKKPKVMGLSDENFENFAYWCESISLCLLKIGFSVDQRQSEIILRKLRLGETLDLTYNVSYPGSDDYRILKDIGTLAENGAEFSHDTIEHARDLKDRRMRGLRGKRIDALTLALERISTGQESKSLMARFSKTPESLAQDWRASHHDGTPRSISFLRGLRTELELIWNEIRTHYASAQSQESWLTDETAFENYFGVLHILNHPALQFGWWNEIQKGPGFSQYGTGKHLDKTREGRGKFEIISEDTLEHLISIYLHKSNTSQSVYSRPAIPNLDLFKFGNLDSEGEFLEHIASSKNSKPTKNWLETTLKFKKQFGTATLNETIIDWSRPLMEGVNEENLQRNGRARRIATLLGSEREYNLSGYFRDPSEMTPKDNAPLEIPSSQVADKYRQRQVALQMIANSQYHVFLDPRSHPDPLYISGNDREFYARHALLAPLSDNNVDVMCGVVHTLALIPNEENITHLRDLGEEFYSKHRGDFRSKKCGNAVLWALGFIGTLEATHALAHLNRRVKDKSVAKLVDKALTSAGKKNGLSLEDIKEMSVQEFGIGQDGQRQEKVGDYTVILNIASSRKTELYTLTPNGERKRGIIKAAKTASNESQLEVIEELKLAAKVIPTSLKDAKRRLISSWVQNRDWNVKEWRQRFDEHGVLSTLTRRLIWTYFDKDNVQDIVWDGASWKDAKGTVVKFANNQARLKLLHPLTSTEKTIEHWQGHFEQTGARQPFAQIWRTQFNLTKAELDTSTYTNRFAGHILQQAPFVAMLRHQGWTSGSKALNDSHSDEHRNLLYLPSANLVASFWTSGVGTDHIHQAHHEYFSSRNFKFVSTDRLCFFKADKRGKPTGEALSLTDVPHMIFSEVLNTLDLIVSRTSIGTDKLWQDMGGDADHPLSETALLTNYRSDFSKSGQTERIEMRHKMLSRVIPKLEIANQCLLKADTLYVDGQYGTYGIHLGSVSVIMQPGNRHICIVPKQETDRTILPFTGDEGLSLILGKAVALAADTKINDPVIVGQIKPN